MKKRMALLVIALLLALSLLQASAALADGGAVLPSIDTCLTEYSDFVSNVEQAKDGTSYLDINVYMDISDRLQYARNEWKDYMDLLVSGPFDLELAWSGADDSNGRHTLLAVFNYVGSGNPGIVPGGAFYKYDASVVVAFYYEDGNDRGMFILQCGAGFDFVNDWSSSSGTSGGDFMPNIPGGNEPSNSGGDFMPNIPTQVEELPDPGTTLRSSSSVTNLEVSQLDDETIDGTLYHVYFYSFGISNLMVGDAQLRNNYKLLLTNAGYQMEPLNGNSENQFAISGGGYTAVLTQEPHDSIYASSWWALYVPEGMPFTFNSSSSNRSSKLPFSPFQNPSFFD